jgi:hypothetical protein
MISVWPPLARSIPLCDSVATATPAYNAHVLLVDPHIDNRSRAIEALRLAAEIGVYLVIH